jgi:putative membrane protein
LRRFYWLVTALIGLILVVFAVANRDPITLNLWPLPITLETRVFIAVLLPLVVGFLMGEVAAWVSFRHHRRQARHATRRVEELERAVAAKTPAKEGSKEIAAN